MRDTPPDQLEDGRHPDLSDSSYGMTGAFEVMGPAGVALRIIANDASDPEAEGWEHVSVSTALRPPRWEEMCFVKELFWEDEEMAIQYHVPVSQHINNHPHVLHLWRDTLHPHPRMPPSRAVGVKDATPEQVEEMAKNWGKE